MTVSARLTPAEKAALIRQHLSDGVPRTRLVAAAGLPVHRLRRQLPHRPGPTASALSDRPGSASAAAGCLSRDRRKTGIAWRRLYRHPPPRSGSPLTEAPSTEPVLASG